MYTTQLEAKTLYASLKSEHSTFQPIDSNNKVIEIS